MPAASRLPRFNTLDASLTRGLLQLAPLLLVSMLVSALPALGEDFQTEKQRQLDQLWMSMEDNALAAYERAQAIARAEAIVPEEEWDDEMRDGVKYLTVNVAYNSAFAVLSCARSQTVLNDESVKAITTCAERLQAEQARGWALLTTVGLAEPLVTTICLTKARLFEDERSYPPFAFMAGARAELLDMEAFVACFDERVLRK